MISNISFSQYKLDIEIKGFRNNTGKIMLQLFNENEKVITKDMSEKKDNKCEFSFKINNPDKYAVRYYYDENINGVMDTNLVGKPTKGYGFYNNVTGMFGPPPFEKLLFEITGDKKIILVPVY